MKIKIAIIGCIVAALCVGCDDGELHTSSTSSDLSTIGGWEPEYWYQIFDDFDTASGPMDCTGCTYTAEAQRPGIAVFASDADGTSARAIPTGDGNTMLLSGAYLNVTQLRITYKVDQLANATDDYEIAFGFCDSGCTNGVWVSHSSADDSWICHASSGGSETTQAAYDSITTDVWHQMTFYVDTDDPQFSTYFNGFSGCWVYDDVPASAPVTPFISMQTIAGDPVSFLVDYMVVDQQFLFRGYD